MSNLSFSGANVVITGGTGSFGGTMVSEILKENPAEVRILSRDENKQDAMRRKLDDPRVKFYLGDVRDELSVSRVIKNTNFVFHAAALKQVPSCDFFPSEAVQTNVMGSTNVIRQSLEYQVESVVCLSTDKAVYPINAMGMSKALMEKVATAEARNNLDSKTRITVTRYGNVMMSRGSVIPLFIDQIRSGIPVTLTNPDMTRFLMSLGESVSLVKHAFLNGANGDLFVQKAPAATIFTLAKAIATILDKKDNFEYKFIGTRHGEKLFESLLSSEDAARAKLEGQYFRVPLDTRSLDYSKFVEIGTESPQTFDSYTSHNTNQLDSEGVIRLLQNDPNFINYLGSLRK